METGMIMEKRELFFLLSCKGLKHCPSVFVPENCGKPEEILENLFRKGRITNEGERFRVNRKQAEIVCQIAESRTFLCLCHGNRKQGLLYLYPGDRILAVQEIFQRKQALRLTYLEREELENYLEEQNMLAGGANWEPLPFTEEAVFMLPEQLKKHSNLEKYPWVQVLAEEMDSSSGQMIHHMGVVRQGFRDAIVREETPGGIFTTEPYERGHFIERLLEWL